MNISLTHKHRKIFAQLFKEQDNLDYRKSVAARDLRIDCVSDREFAKWLDTEFGMSETAAQEMLARAAAVKVVSDSDDWRQFGGFQKIQPVLQFPKKEQVAIIQAAKADSRSIPSVIKLRHPIAPIAPSPSAKSERKRLSDAELLAQFIADNAARLPSLPSDVLVAVRMYVPSFAQTTKRHLKVAA